MAKENKKGIYKGEALLDFLSGSGAIPHGTPRYEDHELAAEEAKKSGADGLYATPPKGRTTTDSEGRKVNIQGHSSLFHLIGYDDLMSFNIGNEADREKFNSNPAEDLQVPASEPSAQVEIPKEIRAGDGQLNINVKPINKMSTTSARALLEQTSVQRTASYDIRGKYQGGKTMDNWFSVAKTSAIKEYKVSDYVDYIIGWVENPRNAIAGNTKLDLAFVLALISLESGFIQFKQIKSMKGANKLPHGIRSKASVFGGEDAWAPNYNPTTTAVGITQRIASFVVGVDKQVGIPNVITDPYKNMDAGLGYLLLKAKESFVTFKDRTLEQKYWATAAAYKNGGGDVFNIKGKFDSSDEKKKKAFYEAMKDYSIYANTVMGRYDAFAEAVKDSPLYADRVAAYQPGLRLNA